MLKFINSRLQSIFIVCTFLIETTRDTKGRWFKSCHFILWNSMLLIMTPTSRRVWRYQRGNQNPYIEEEQTTQRPKGKGQKDKQRSTTHTYKTKDRVTRTPLKTGGELRCSGRVSSSCSTSGTHHVNLVTNPVISREWGKDREVEHVV